MHRVTLGEVTPQPWRNGGGLTRELLAWPDASHWRLRVSVARIAADGPFSAFEGTSRHFAVLAGAGVCLHWPGREQWLRPGDGPFGFDGAHPPGCRLIDGPTDDLNLMLRAEGGMARAQPHQPWQHHTPWRGAYLADAGHLHVGASVYVLDAGTLVWRWNDAQPWTLEGPGHAFWLHAELSA
jgi:uncharacterized protein